MIARGRRRIRSNSEIYHKRVVNVSIQLIKLGDSQLLQFLVITSDVRAFERVHQCERSPSCPTNGICVGAHHVMKPLDSDHNSPSFYVADDNEPARHNVNRLATIRARNILNLSHDIKSAFLPRPCISNPLPFTACFDTSCSDHQPRVPGQDGNRTQMGRNNMLLAGQS
jgi:hypothetical protein